MYMESLQNVQTDTQKNNGSLTDAGQYDDLTLTEQQMLDLKPKQAAFIDMMAFASIEVDTDGRVTMITKEEMARRLGVTSKTLYRWRQSIPNYAELVKQRRYEKFKTQIEDGVWRGLMLRAFKGEKAQAEMVLSHFGDYVPPTQQVKVDTTDNISDLFNMLRERKENRASVVDAEVVHNPVDDVQNPDTQQAPERELATLDRTTTVVDTPTIPPPQPTAQPTSQPDPLPTTTHFDPPQPKNANEWA